MSMRSHSYPLQGIRMCVTSIVCAVAPHRRLANAGPPPPVGQGEGDSAGTPSMALVSVSDSRSGGDVGDNFNAGSGPSAFGHGSAVLDGRLDAPQERRPASRV
jgi:hypothetical protein